MIVKNGLIHDSVNKDAYLADIKIENGKIAAIAPDLVPAAGEEVVDAAGMNVYAGFVDAHSHLGLDNYAVGYEGHDYNEMGDIVAAQLRGIDSYYCQDESICHALEGGVTTVGTGPGSANVLGGTFVAVKTYGNNVDDAAIKAEVAMKCAFGENPKRCYRDKGDSARMTTAAKLRGMLIDAKDYMLRKEAAGDDYVKRPKFDMKMEALIPVLKGEMPLKAHAHRSDDICTAIRIAKEFGVKMTLEHVTEGHLIVDEIVKSGFPCAVGPTMTNASKVELKNKSFTTPGILSKAGVQVSIITDAPVIQQQYLPLCAGFAVKAGMDEFEALKAITINPAKHLGIEDRVGSLEVGKDADIVIAEGDVMYTSGSVKTVIVDGKRLVG